MLFVKASGSRNCYKLIIEYIINGGTRISDGGWGGGGNPDPEITGEAVSKKFCLALQTSVWFKRRGGIQVPRAPPLGPQLKME